MPMPIRSSERSRSRASSREIMRLRHHGTTRRECHAGRPGIGRDRARAFPARPRRLWPRRVPKSDAGNFLEPDVLIYAIAHVRRDQNGALRALLLSECARIAYEGASNALVAQRFKHSDIEEAGIALTEEQRADARGCFTARGHQLPRSSR